MLPEGQLFFLESVQTSAQGTEESLVERYVRGLIVRVLAGIASGSRMGNFATLKLPRIASGGSQPTATEKGTTLQERSAINAAKN